MPKTSALRYPTNDIFIRVSRSLFLACDRNTCAAALVAFFAECHDARTDSREYAFLYNAMARDTGASPIIDVSCWQFHTMPQLQSALFLYSDNVILTALKLLESKGFLETEVPDRLQAFADTERARWFLLRTDKLNEWFDHYEKLTPTQASREFPAPSPKPKAKAKPVPDKYIDDATTVLEYRNMRRIEAWANRGRRVRATRITADHLVLVADLLREGYTVNQLCYAVEGLVLNPFWMGDNERSTAYDDIQYVFGKKRVDRHIGYAEQHGITTREIKARLAKLTGAPEKKVPDYKSIVNIIVPYVLFPDDAPDIAERLKEYDGDFDTNAIFVELQHQVKVKAGLFVKEHFERWEQVLKIIKTL